jgi:hypothetical protein
VKKPRSEFAIKPATAPPPAPGGLGQAWVRFWFTPSDPVGLHLLRVLAGLLFLAWLLPFMGHLDSLFGIQGFFDQQAYAEAARLQDGPPKPITWSLVYLCGNNSRLLLGLYGASLAVLALFTLGVATRLTGVLTWVIVASFTANPALDYDADALLLVLAFYLMIGYLLLGQRRGISLVERLLGARGTFLLGQGPDSGKAGSRPSLGTNLALRLLQVHFAIIVVTSGLHKLQFGEWWAGVAFWYPLYPPFEATLTAARKHVGHREWYLGLLSTAAYITLAWQIGFPLFAWRPRWRVVLLGGAVLAWLATALLYRMPWFGPAYFLGCLSYVTPDGWRLLLRGLTRVPGLQALAAPAAGKEAESLVAVGNR